MTGLPEQKFFVIHIVGQGWFLGNLSVTPFGFVSVSTTQYKTVATPYKSTAACAVACNVLRAAGFDVYTEVSCD